LSLVDFRWTPLVGKQCIYCGMTATEDELDELTGNLKKRVFRWQNQKRIAHARLVWSVAAYLANIDQTNDFAPFIATIGTITTAA